jgi:hypothetical protein
LEIFMKLISTLSGLLLCGCAAAPTVTGTIDGKPSLTSRGDFKLMVSSQEDQPAAKAVAMREAGLHCGPKQPAEVSWDQAGVQINKAMMVPLAGAFAKHTYNYELTFRCV